MPGPVSRFRGCTSTFAPGRVASCGRASSMCPRLTIASIRSGGTNGATRASVASRSERLPMIRQYCLGIGAPAISRVRGWSRVPSRCADPYGRFEQRRRLRVRSFRRLRPSGTGSARARIRHTLAEEGDRK